MGQPHADPVGAPHGPLPVLKCDACMNRATILYLKTRSGVYSARCGDHPSKTSFWDFAVGVTTVMTHG